jgi:hypothetical protein
VAAAAKTKAASYKKAGLNGDGGAFVAGQAFDVARVSEPEAGSARRRSVALESRVGAGSEDIGD